MKSYQVLLPQWLESHIRKRVDVLDLSFSEIIRLQICISILAFQNIRYPEYETSMSLEYLSKLIKKMAKTDFERDEVLQFCSEVYFETRKDLDYRNKNENDARLRK